METVFNRDDFGGLKLHTWLYSGAETPPHRGVQMALEEYFKNRGLGPEGREKNSAVEARCKANLAALMGGEASQIALLSNASEAINAVAMSLGWEAGDNVVINTLDFPCGVLPWLGLQDSGVAVRVVPHTNWEITPSDIMARVDARTKLVMTSHVSYLSGARLDYGALYDALKPTGALLLLDVTQSLGVVPVDMKQADIVVSSTYKWLLGTHGVGVMAINPARTADLGSHAVGWRSVPDIFTPDRFQQFTPHADARRFELGYPAYPSIYALESSTGLLLETGIDRISAHVLALGQTLLDALREHGFTVMTPTPAARRAGNIAVVCAEGDRMAAALRAEDILVWGGDGRVRASIHGFNDGGDIERYVEALVRHTAGAV